MKTIDITYIDTTNYTVNIEYDAWAESPREWDNVGTMYCSHRSYTLGDEQFDTDDFSDWASVDNYLRIERNAIIVLPLGLYDHSGITMYIGDTHDRWDGGQVGFIYCTQADIDREWDGDRKKAEAYLRSEVATYDQYLRGDVYNVTITSAGNDDIEQCGSIYGAEGVLEFLNESINGYQLENLTLEGDASGIL